MTTPVETVARALDETNYIPARLCAELANVVLQSLTASGYAVVPRWQPIETSPKDGTWVLLYDRDGHIRVGMWERTADASIGPHWVYGPEDDWGNRAPVFDATHWMYLPADPSRASPPSTAVQAAKGGE